MNEVSQALDRSRESHSTICGELRFGTQSALESREGDDVESPGVTDSFSETRGGGGGIRTPGTVSGTAVFKTAAFNRSATPPEFQCIRARPSDQRGRAAVCARRVSDGRTRRLSARLRRASVRTTRPLLRDLSLADAWHDGGSSAAAICDRGSATGDVMIRRP